MDAEYHAEMRFIIWKFSEEMNRIQCEYKAEMKWIRNDFYRREPIDDLPPTTES